MTKETAGGWIEEIPQVEIELLDNGNVRVTDHTDMNGDHSVDLHPMHLRFIAEKIGLVREMSASEADALRTVDKLARRLRVLHQRIEQVHEWMWQNSERGFDDCDINVEAWYMDATLDLSKEFLTEIEESRAMVTPMPREQRDQSRDASVTAQKSCGGKPKANPEGPGAQGNLPV